MLDRVRVPSLLGLGDDCRHSLHQRLLQPGRHAAPEFNHLRVAFHLGEGGQQGHDANFWQRLDRAFYEGLQVGRQGGVGLQRRCQAGVVGHAGGCQARLQIVRQGRLGWEVVGHEQCS